jgi:Tfp pilus assembly protein PilX
MPISNAPRVSAGSNERGFALVVSVVVMMMIGIVAVTYFALSSGERALSSNVHVARGALYAADAGVRTVEQVLANRAKAKLDSLALVWSGVGPLIANPSTFFPAGATVASSTNPVFSASGTVSFSDSTLTPEAQAYDYIYTVVSSGGNGAHGQRVVQSQGVLRVSASRGSFADFLLFTQSCLLPNGSGIWITSDTHFDGRVHTNGEFYFAYKPTFQDLVTSVNAKAWYYNQGDPVERNANNNGTTDVPQFYGGFQRSAASIALPPNSFGQQNAALGLNPASTIQPSYGTIRTQLGLPASSSPPPDGIYFPNSGGALTGGIYVQGNLGQCLMQVDSLGRQVYVLQQGTATRTVTVDPVANTTRIWDGTTAVDYTGVPRGILYCQGGVTDLRGPDRVYGAPPPAVADGTQFLITATSDIVVQRDVTCQNYDEGSAVLGLFSSGGSVRVGTGAPNDMNLDAFVMATGASGAFQVDEYDFGSARGAFHLRGGIVSTCYGAFYTFNADGSLRSGYARDFHYDRRGLVPPYYPTTPRMVPDRPTARTVAWKER